MDQSESAVEVKQDSSNIRDKGDVLTLLGEAATVLELPGGVAEWSIAPVLKTDSIAAPARSHLIESPRLTHQQQSDAAPRVSPGVSPGPEIDPLLAAVVAVWPTLPEPTRAAILALASVVG